MTQKGYPVFTWKTHLLILKKKEKSLPPPDKVWHHSPSAIFLGSQSEVFTTSWTGHHHTCCTHCTGKQQPQTPLRSVDMYIEFTCVKSV